MLCVDVAGCDQSDGCNVCVVDQLNRSISLGRERFQINHVPLTLKNADSAFLVLERKFSIVIFILQSNESKISADSD